MRKQVKFIVLNEKSARYLLWLCLGLIFSFFLNCAPSRILLSPLPSRIESFEGHAKLNIIGEGGSARSKFSFLFQLPSRGRIEVSDFLGSTIYQIIINPEGAYLVIPRKSAYWKGEEEEIIERFLGFRLNLKEMISLISGSWEGMGTPEGDGKEEGWMLIRDREGRIMSGRRGNLGFEVSEFIENTRIARIIIFDYPLNSGQVKVLKIAMNKPVKEIAFSTGFIQKFQRKTWEEIQALLEK